MTKITTCSWKDYLENNIWGQVTMLCVEKRYIYMYVNVVYVYAYVYLFSGTIFFDATLRYLISLLDLKDIPSTIWVRNKLFSGLLIGVENDIHEASFG